MAHINIASIRRWIYQQRQHLDSLEMYVAEIEAYEKQIEATADAMDEKYGSGVFATNEVRNDV